MDDHIRGKWVRATVCEPRCLPGYCVHEPVRVITVPPWDVKQETDRKKKNSPAQGTSPIAKPPVARSSRRWPCPIARLPDELLLQIFEYLVPTGMTFQVFRYARPQTFGRPLGTVIHAFGETRTGIWPPESADGKEQSKAPSTALVSVCRRFADLYLSLLYGGNAWIIEFAKSAVDSRIKSSDMNQRKPPSWSRWYPGKPAEPWPLTARSAKYVRDLTFLVTLRRHQVDGQLALLQSQLDHALEILGSGHQLKQLRVHMLCSDSLPTQCFKPAASKVAVCYVPHEMHLSWSTRPDGTHELHIVPDEQDPSSEERAHLDGLWKPFARLRGVKSVKLSGLIGEGKAEEMASDMMQEAAPTDACERQVKRRRLGLRPTRRQCQEL